MTQGPEKSRLEELALRSRWLMIEGICIANFLSFSLVGLLIGGSAMLGGSQGNHYFVGEHGHLTEVSFGLWAYSWAHTLSQVATFPLAVVAAFRYRLAGESLSPRGRGTV